MTHPAERSPAKEKIHELKVREDFAGVLYAALRGIRTLITAYTHFICIGKDIAFL